MPHRPASKQYERFDDLLSKYREASEVLALKDWTPKQEKHITEFFQPEIVAPPPPEKSREELARDALIKLAGTRRLTGPERRKLANLNRRLKAKERQQLRRRRSRRSR